MLEVAPHIVEKAAQGDREAFKFIYDTFGDFVYRLAWRMLRHEQDAEEVAQDVFLQVYKKLKYFRQESSLKTWIFRIAVNLTLNYRKKMSRNRKRLAAYRDQETEQYQTRRKNMDMFKEDYQKAIDRLLNMLNPEQRICVVLRSIEKMSYEEIAQTLNINVNTVRSRVMRAREKMMSLKEVIMHELR
ncbi:MAG: sigma-70 family RNA polymerase sigma factor [Candidatus Omnitrophica bacterium]|nr:sigma-70 family RNA polymerase sigma factor [Candidatus Omnitrophota bacterium]